MLRFRALLSAAGLVVATGCHRWIPAPPPQGPGPGAIVEVTLTADGTAAVTSLVGPNVGSLRGEVLATNGDTIRIAVQELMTRDGQPLYLQGLSLDLPSSAASSVRQRQFDRRRTAIAVAVAAAGTVALIRAVRFGGDGILPGNGGGNPALIPR